MGTARSVQRVLMSQVFDAYKPDHLTWREDNIPVDESQHVFQGIWEGIRTMNFVILAITISDEAGGNSGRRGKAKPLPDGE